MKIAFNCISFLNRHYTGIGRYAHSLVKSFAEIDRENTYYLYARKGLLNTKRVLPRFEKENFILRRDIFNFGVNSTVGKVDLYHSPSPAMIKIKDAKIVVTVHDLVYKVFPEGHTQETLRRTDNQFLDFIPKASKIICPSTNTLRDLHKYFDVDEAKTCVIPQGIDKNLFYRIAEEDLPRATAEIESLGVNKPFILAVGTIEPRKNLKNVFRSFAVLKEKKLFDGKLVIAGMKGWNSADIFSMADELNIKDEVMFLGFVTNNQLRCLYNLADVFIFPSFYEGFGYPIIEAFSCGAAVVTSNSSSCAEVAQDAALLTDPHDHENIAAAVAKVLQDTELRNTLKTRAIEQAKGFSYLQTAQKTLEVYKEVYAQ
jgi:glycosyltransferase involved in cell wall biosynthesis